MYRRSWQYKAFFTSSFWSHGTLTFCYIWATLDQLPVSTSTLIQWPDVNAVEGPPRREGWDVWAILGSYGLTRAQTSTSSRTLRKPMSARRSSRGQSQSIDAAPNKYTLNAALKECTGVILWTQSMATLRRMYDEGVEVDLIALSTGTAACARTGVFFELLKKGCIAPSISATYNHIHNIMMFFRKYISGANYRACIYPCVVLERCLN